MELTQYEAAHFIYVVRFKRLGGESAQYRDICTKVLNCMHL